MRMINRFSLIIVLCFLAINLFGQDAQIDYTASKKDWGFSITPYALFASQSTDVGGEKIRQSFNDLASVIGPDSGTPTCSRCSKSTGNGRS